jgi:hypothetical protein
LSNELLSSQPPFQGAWNASRTTQGFASPSFDRLISFGRVS